MSSIPRQLYRRLRLLIKSRLFLPSFVRILANNKEAKLSTRNFPTANVALWLKTRDVLDYEPEERALLEPLFKDCKTFWDIGAQIGFYSIVAALNDVPNIIAIDLDPIYAETIKKHATNNDFKIDVQSIATGISGEIVTFENYGKTNSVEAMSLDELWTVTGNKPDVIKMDIDGGELKTLQGAKNLLSGKNSPKIIIEFDPRFDLVELAKILTEYGYSLKGSAGNNQLWVKWQ